MADSDKGKTTVVKVSVRDVVPVGEVPIDTTTPFVRSIPPEFRQDLGPAFHQRHAMRSHARYDVWAAGAAVSLNKSLDDVTESERHRFRVAFQDALAAMDPGVLAILSASREPALNVGYRPVFATPEQCDGDKVWRPR